MEAELKPRKFLVKPQYVERYWAVVVEARTEEEAEEIAERLAADYRLHDGVTEWESEVTEAPDDAEVNVQFAYDGAEGLPLNGDIEPWQIGAGGAAG